jgi:UDP-GlcNAc:undecaprenyl-phosphate/decaprenyl-phosphate GlcNAc-1-phosphate transferase
MVLLLPLAAAFLAALALTPVIRAVARSAGLIAAPSKDRWHAKPTALLGGAAVYGGFLVGIAVALLAVGDASTMWETLGRPGLGILLGSSLMFLVGLADDRLRLRPSTKLIFQGLAAAIVISFGVIYPVTPWTVVNVLVTFFWFLALTNALNLLDNMDGVAVGVAAVAALFLAMTFFWEGAIVLAAVCMALAGAALGFLPYNFHKASIFMGDSGSLFIGGLLASLGAAYPATAPASIISVLFVPAAIVIIPILDTLLVTVSRTLAGRPISVGGRDHTSHRLVAMGLSERQVALLLYAFAAGGGLLAMVLRGASGAVGLSLGAVFLVGLLAFAAYLGKLHSYSPTETPAGRVTWLISDLLHKRRAFEVVLDLILFAVAYQAAYLLRWDGRIPAEQLVLLEPTIAIAVACKLGAFGVLGVYRGSWHQLSIRDVHRLAEATVLGSLLTVVVLTFLFPTGEFSRSVFILDGMLVALLTTATRASFRTLDLVQHSLKRGGTPVLLYGAGKAGELVVRELQANPELGMRPVGFLDDDPAKHGRLVLGYPVLGGGRDAAAFLRRREIRKVIVCSKKLQDAAVEELCAICRSLDVEMLELEMQFRTLKGPRPSPEIARLPREQTSAEGPSPVAIRGVPLRTA